MGGIEKRDLLTSITSYYVLCIIIYYIVHGSIFFWKFVVIALRVCELFSLKLNKVQAFPFVILNVVLLKNTQQSFKLSSISQYEKFFLQILENLILFLGSYMSHKAFAWKIMRPVFQVIWRESKIIHNLVLLWVSMHTQSLIRVQLCDPMDCSTPGSSVRGISQVRILVWDAISFSRGSPQPKVQTHVSCISCIGR